MKKGCPCTTCCCGILRAVSSSGGFGVSDANITRALALQFGQYFQESLESLSKWEICELLDHSCLDQVFIIYEAGVVSICHPDFSHQLSWEYMPRFTKHHFQIRDGSTKEMVVRAVQKKEQDIRFKVNENALKCFLPHFYVAAEKRVDHAFFNRDVRILVQANEQGGFIMFYLDLESGECIKEFFRGDLRALQIRVMQRDLEFCQKNPAP